MVLTLTEAAVDAVKAYLDANLSAKLDTLDAEYNDGIVLADIAGTYVAEQSLESVPRFPALFILGDGMDVQRWTPDYTEAAHRLLIGVIVLDQDVENLRRRMYRYMRAVWELLTEARAAAAFMYAIGSPSVSYSPVYTRESQYLADARLAVSMLLAEAR